MKKIICWLIGHQYKVAKAFSYSSRAVFCKRCRSVWGMNDEVRAIVPWDGELSKLHGWSPFEYDSEFEVNPTQETR